MSSVYGSAASASWNPERNVQERYQVMMNKLNISISSLSSYIQYNLFNKNISYILPASSVPKKSPIAFF